MFFDEIHLLRNYSTALHKACLQIKSRRNFGLTGTAIQNCLMDLWALFNIVNPRLLGDQRDNFKEYYINPVLQMRKVRVVDSAKRKGMNRLHELQEKVRCFMLRRTKSEQLANVRDCIVVLTHSLTHYNNKNENKTGTSEEARDHHVLQVNTSSSQNLR